MRLVLGFNDDAAGAQGLQLAFVQRVSVTVIQRSRENRAYLQTSECESWCWRVSCYASHRFLLCRGRLRAPQIRNLDARGGKQTSFLPASPRRGLRDCLEQTRPPLLRRRQLRQNRGLSQSPSCWLSFPTRRWLRSWAERNSIQRPAGR